MSKEVWKAGNMLYPLPVVMVSCKRGTEPANIITVAWAGTVCTNPPMVSISVRPERYSYSIIEETKEFVINLTTTKLAKATDYCGVRSGRNVDKFKEMHLTEEESHSIHATGIKESPVNIECKVQQIIKLGSHDMFIASVEAIKIDPSLLNEKGKLELNRSNPIVYSHGEYYDLGNLIGTFGYSVKKDTSNYNKGKKEANKKEINKKALFDNKEEIGKKEVLNKKRTVNKKETSNKKNTLKQGIKKGSKSDIRSKKR